MRPAVLVELKIAQQYCWQSVLFLVSGHLDVLDEEGGRQFANTRAIHRQVVTLWSRREGGRDSVHLLPFLLGPTCWPGFKVICYR